MIGQLLALLGATLTLLSGIGVVRFDDALARMHALTKASTVGLVLVLLGAALTLDNVNDITSLVLASALQLLTSPVGANLIGATTYLARRADGEPDNVDEVGIDEAANSGPTPDDDRAP